jgi:O-antigen/teichoic acid export membrane protein
MANPAVTPPPLPPRSPTTATSPDEHAHRRDRMARYAAAANLVALVAQAALTIATVRLTLPYLGEERFGAWMAVLGIAGVLTFADLGIGNALVARVAAARAGAAGVEPSVVVTGGLACLLVVGVGAGLLAAAACAVIPWAALMRVPPPSEIEAEFRTAAIVFGLLFGVFLFTSGVRKVYEGLQLGYLAHLMMALCSAVSLVLLLLATRQRSGIPLLTGATFGVTAVLPVALMVPLVWAGHFRPAFLLDAARREWRRLVGVGSQYSIVQVGGLLLSGSEPMLVAALRGSGPLAGLAVVQRLFQIAATPTRILVAPSWAAYADAHARGDRRYLRHTLLRQMGFSGLLTLAIAVPLAVCSGPVLAIWTKQALTVDIPLVFAACCLCILDGFLLPFGMYLNGIGCVRPQAAATLCALVTYFPAKVAALAYGGITWMLWTTIAFQVFNSLIFYLVLYRDEVWHALREE